MTFALPAQSAYEATLKRRQLSGWSPPHSQVKSDAVWDELLAAAAAAKERQAALRAIVDQVRADEEWTKVVVFAPAGSAFDSAAAALRALPRPVLIGDPTDPSSTDRIDKFSRPDIRDPDAPLVLLMSFDHSSALNLQHVSHHIVFYAPLWGDDEGGVHAAANEQQAIGRVFRIGQARDVLVHISLYLPISPYICLCLPGSRPGARCGRAPARGRRPEEPADHRAADRRPQHARGRHAAGRHRVRNRPAPRRRSQSCKRTLKGARGRFSDSARAFLL